MKLKFLKLFESYKREISLSEVLPKIPFEWSPDDPQIYKGGRYSESPPFIYKRDNTLRRPRGGLFSFIEKLPSWIKFTNRKKSIIGTNNENYANTWGENHIIVPLEDEIFVCNGKDFNLRGSFSYIDKFSKRSDSKIDPMWIIESLYYVSFVGIDILDDAPIYVDNVNKVIENLNKESIERGLKVFSKINEIELPFNFDDCDYGTKKMVSEFTKDFIPNFKYEDVGFYVISDLKYRTEYVDMFKLFNYISDINLYSYDLINHLYDPIRNGFRKMKYTDYIKEIRDDEDLNNEVWFESDCIFMSLNDLTALKEI